MTTSKKLVFGVLVLSVVAFVALRRGGGQETQVEVDHKLVVDRFWIDHIPKNDRDIIQVFVAISEQPIGVFDAASQWTLKAELFQYEAHGGELRVFYGQTGERETIKVTAQKCDQGGFELCMSLDGASRGVTKYYSMEDWVIDGTDQMDHVRAKIAALIKPE
jgi:hypothetical protein